MTSARALVESVCEQVLPANPYPGVVAAGNRAERVLFAIPGPARIAIIVECLNDPCLGITIPLLGDVFRSKRNEAGRVDNDVQACTKYRLLGPEYFNPAFAALSPDILDMSRRTIGACDGLT